MSAEINNKLIAEFMQIPKCKRCENCGAYQYGAGIIFHPKEMLYNSSWDWIMPVCKKICKTTPYNSYLAIETMTVFADIEDVYKAVVEFIEWHNKPDKMVVDE